MVPGGTVLNIEKGQWHSLKCLESGTVLLEAKDGTFEPLGEDEVMNDLDLGIRVSVAQFYGKTDLDSVNADYNFTIQNSFYEDYCDGHYKCKDQEIKSTILAVTEAVTEQNLRQMHAIRTGKKGNDPQLIRHDYGAQRRNITTSIKLAYWKKGRVYKIANMRKHDFFEPTWENMR